MSALAILAGLAAFLFVTRQRVAANDARRRADTAAADLELLRRQVIAIDAEDRDAAGEPRL